jgi:hypothetical protein
MVRLTAQPAVWRSKAEMHRSEEGEFASHLAGDEHLDHASREDSRPAPATPL